MRSPEQKMDTVNPEPEDAPDMQGENPNVPDDVNDPAEQRLDTEFDRLGPSEDTPASTEGAPRSTP